VAEEQVVAVVEQVKVVPRDYDTVVEEHFQEPIVAEVVGSIEATVVTELAAAFIEATTEAQRSIEWVGGS